MTRSTFSLVLVVAAASACGGNKQAEPRERPPLTVPPPKSTEGDDTSEPPARTGEKPTPEVELSSDSAENVHVEVERDAGFISIRASTVRDGGFSFRMSGSFSVSSDGGAVTITVGGDGGVP